MLAGITTLATSPTLSCDTASSNPGAKIKPDENDKLIATTAKPLRNGMLLALELQLTEIQIEMGQGTPANSDASTQSQPETNHITHPSQQRVTQRSHTDATHKRVTSHHTNTHLVSLAHPPGRKRRVSHGRGCYRTASHRPAAHTSTQQYSNTEVFGYVTEKRHTLAARFLKSHTYWHTS